MSEYRLGVDIGGTFTDFALFDTAGASLHIHKCLTTPDDPSRAVVDGTVALLARESVEIGDLHETAKRSPVQSKAACRSRVIRRCFNAGLIILLYKLTVKSDAYTCPLLRSRPAPRALHASGQISSRVKMKRRILTGPFNAMEQLATAKSSLHHEAQWIPEPKG